MRLIEKGQNLVQFFAGVADQLLEPDHEKRPGKAEPALDQRGPLLDPLQNKLSPG